ncbi:NUC153 domain-containing protein, partial [Cardiosporidium cionae]
YTPKELEQMDVEDFIGSESDFDNSEDETESIKTSDVDTKFLRVDEKNLEDYRKLLLGDLMKDEEVSTDDASPAIKKMQRKISLGEKEKAFLSPIETPASVLTSPHGQTKEENKIVSAEEKHPPKKKKSWKNKNIEETASRRAMENQAELELLMDKDENRHFDMHDPKVYQKNKKKRKNMEENISSFQINTDDSRFSKIFTHSEYTIDPTNPNFKKTQASEQLLQEKRKRRAVSKETAKLRTKKQLNGMNDKMDAETSVHEDVVSDIQIFKPRKKS